MPNLITHDIFAEEVLNTIDSKYKKIIQIYKEEYRIGANGPDFLFFHDLFPLWKKQNPTISKMGSGLHSKNINDFYESAIDVYYHSEESALKEAMASYLIGHFLHWRLDSIMHPYVVYRTGFKEENSSIYHHRFESMMDTIILKEKRQQTIYTFETPKICKTGIHSVNAISNYYIPCIKKCLDTTITKKEIEQALMDWEKVQKCLYDPKGIKFKLLFFMEKLFKKDWAISCNMVLLEEDEQHDIMNRNHEKWFHPCTNEEHNESVNELFDKAVESAKEGIKLLTKAMETNEKEDILNFIDNVTYNNGTNQSNKRLYKDVIYEKKAEL